MKKLYGDGIHDDYPYIQKLLDSKICEICLPTPKVCYVISKTLKIHSNQTLKLPRFATIKLADKANCEMIENADFENFNSNICIEGGIWDMNHNNQWPNPYHFPDDNGKYYFDKLGANHRDMSIFSTISSFIRGVYSGMCMRFCRIKNFTLKNLTIKNPVVYGAQLGYIEDFTVEDIIFDYTEGSPKLWNMDGIHVEGYCKNGLITNLKGATHDDLVALTADDGLYGPIDNVVIDGIYAYGAHSAVRLLSHGYPVKNVTIKNVFGSYYVYCIGLTKYHGPAEERGFMENIIIENVFACTSEGTKDVAGGKYFIWVQKGVDVENLQIKNVCRDERTYPISTIKVDEGAFIKRFKLEDVIVKNRTGENMQSLNIGGKVEDLEQKNVVLEVLE